ncbi:hypothetical protein A2U01_0045971, partial [Trifolium medium]|nr:hypothetical protein [Trifolium medium]
RNRRRLGRGNAGDGGAENGLVAPPLRDATSQRLGVKGGLPVELESR